MFSVSLCVTEETLAMEVDVRVFATLRKYLPQLDIGEPLHMDVEPGTTLGEICDRLGISRDEVKVVSQNGRHVSFDTPAEANARIAFIPAVGGG